MLDPGLVGDFYHWVVSFDPFFDSSFQASRGHKSHFPVKETESEAQDCSFPNVMKEARRSCSTSLFSRQVGCCESQPQLSAVHSPPRVQDQIFKEVTIHLVHFTRRQRQTPHAPLTHSLVCAVAHCVFVLRLICAKPVLCFFFSAVGGCKASRRREISLCFL